MDKNEKLTPQEARERIKSLRSIVDTPKLVGDDEGLVPYAWRNPIIIDMKKSSKVLRVLAQEKILRETKE